MTEFPPALQESDLLLVQHGESFSSGGNEPVDVEPLGFKRFGEKNFDIGFCAQVFGFDHAEDAFPDSCVGDQPGVFVHDLQIGRGNAGVGIADNVAKRRPYMAAEADFIEGFRIDAVQGFKRRPDSVPSRKRKSGLVPAEDPGDCPKIRKGGFSAPS